MKQEELKHSVNEMMSRHSEGECKLQGGFLEGAILEEHPASLSRSEDLCSVSSVMDQLFVTPWTVAHQAPLSMGIIQARIQEWVAMSFSWGSSRPRD